MGRAFFFRIVGALRAPSVPGLPLSRDGEALDHLRVYGYRTEDEVLSHKGLESSWYRRAQDVRKKTAGREKEDRKP